VQLGNDVLAFNRNDRYIEIDRAACVIAKLPVAETTCSQ